MWLAGFRKKNKGFVIQDFSSLKNAFQKDHVRKIIQFSEAEIAANFDITPKVFMFKDWNMIGVY